MQCISTRIVQWVPQSGLPGYCFKRGAGEGAITKAAKVKKQNMLNGYAKVCEKQASAPLGGTR